MRTGRSARIHRWIAGAAAALSLAVSTSVCFASPRELKAVDEAIRTRGRRWLAQETSVSRLPGSARKMRLGLLKPASADGTAPETQTAAPGPMFLAPASFDWRNHSGLSYVTPVRDQKSCGSCWAFATTAALESNLLLTTGAGGNLAEQILVSCSGAGSCNGGYIDRASNFIRDTGLPGETAYPYSATDGACVNALAGWQAATAGITSWHYVGGTSRPTATQLKEELFTYGPLVTTMSVYSDFYYYAGGVYQYASGTLQGGHAILLVGYDDAQQCFIAKNSWGGGWGESGYFKIGYSELGSSVGFGRYSQAYYTDTAAPSITVRTPNGGESWERGTTHVIQWAYTGKPAAAVDISLYDGDLFVGAIASGVPIGSGGVGSYGWSIPLDQAAVATYRVLVATSDAAYADTSDEPFTITAPVPPSVTIAAPNGGEVWARGTQRRISWTSTGKPGTYLRIELLDAGIPVATLTTKARTAAGYFTWKIPTRLAPGSSYTLRATSTANAACSDASDAPFTIQ